MKQDKAYYEQFLRHKEAELLDSIGDILQIELVLYDLRKLYFRALDLEDGKEIAIQLQDQERQLRQFLLSEQTHLADLELDIAHAKFMIDQLNQ